MVPSLTAKSNAADNADVILWADPSTHRLLVNASVTISGITGTLTNNNAAPAATNIGSLVALANAAAPSWTEGNQVLLSTDLAGALRVTGSLSVGGTTDNSAYTAGSSTGTPAMGFYHSTIDSVTDGRAAAVAITPKRAMMVNLQTAAGVEITNTSNALDINIKSGNLTTLPVTNAGTFAVQATPVTQADTFMLGGVNIKEINAVTPLMGNGVTGTGSQRVTIASDNTAFAVNATLSAETTKVIGTINLSAAQTLATVTTVGTVTTVSTVTNLAQMNGVALLMGNGATGTGSQRVTIASDNTPFPIKMDQTTPGTTNAVSISHIAATAVVPGGLAGTLAVGGATATNVAITDNPLNNGAQAVSSENAAVTTARKVQLVADLVGKLIVLPYANPENFVSGVTAAMTGTTTTSLIAAPAAGLRNYVTHIIATNSHATVGTFIIIQDGSGGTTIYEGYAAAVGGGFSITFPTPLRQPTTATAIFCANVTTGANTIVSASGYKGA